MKYLHTMVRARDLDETLDFYCSKLGLVQVKRHDSEAGRFSLVFLAAPADVERAREGSSPLLEITWKDVLCSCSGKSLVCVVFVKS